MITITTNTATTFTVIALDITITKENYANIIYKLFVVQ